MKSAKLDFSFKKKLQIKLLLSSTTSSQCILPKMGVDRELMSKKGLLSKRNSSFTYSLLLGHAHTTIFTWHETTNYLNTKGFHGGAGNRLRWITKFKMEVVDIFLARGSSWLCPFTTDFLKKLDSDYPTIMCLDSAIEDDITIHRLDHYVISIVTLIIFPCESLHNRENRFAPALEQNFRGHRVWINSVPSTCQMLTCSLSFL